jgi:carbon-monoxide dehydrogenase large subunit
VTLWSATQIPHILRVLVAGARSASPSRSSASIAPDVGGGFGSKLDVYAEELLASRSRAASAAREVGRGALGERRRDDPRPRLRHELTLAATKDGTITAVRRT